MAVGTTRDFTTRVIVNGVNNLSQPIGVGVAKSIGHLKSLEARATKTAYATRQIGQTFTAIGLGIAAPLIYAGKQAVMFEDKMADVSKVTNTAVGSKEFKKMSEEVKGLSVYLGTSATQAADLYTTLAQGGTKVKDLEAIAKIAGRTAVAFGVTEDEAGKAFSRIQNVMDMTIEKTGLVGDAINALSNTRNATASEILTFLSSGGIGVAKMYGMRPEDAAAFGATLRATVTPSAEEAATVMERFGKAIVKSSTLTKVFNAAGKGAKGFVAVMNKGLASKDPSKFFLNMGEYGNQIYALAKGMNGPKGLTNALTLVGREANYAGGVMSEFQNKQSTMLSYLKREWAAFQNVIIDFGDNVTPVLKSVIEDIKPIVKSIGMWIKENPIATKGIIEMAVAMAALSITVAAGSFLLTGIATSIRVVTAAMLFFKTSGVIVALTTQFTELGAFLGIFGISLTGVAVAAGTVTLAIAGLGYVIYKTFEDIFYLPKALLRLGTGMVALGKNIFPALGAAVTGQFDKAIGISAKADMEADMNYQRIWSNMGGSLEKEPYVGPLSGKQPWNPLTPAALPTGGAFGKMPTTSNYQFSPTINVNGNLAPGGQQVLDDAMKNGQAEFERFMKQYQREQDRRSLK